MVVIYKATNLINNKSYIGIDSYWPNRKSQHLSNARNNNKDCKYFHKAIRKYGEGNFNWEVLFQSDDYAYTLKEMEPFFIFYHGTYFKWKNGGYNLTLGGEGVLGNKHTETTKEKISKVHKGKKISKEQKEFLSKKNSGEGNHMYGKNHSQESKQKIREANLGNKYRLGTKHSEETKEKFRIPKSEETKEKLRQIATGRLLSNETKKKISEKLTGVRNPFFGRKHSEETKQKISQAKLRKKNNTLMGVYSH
jgi:group I intron endonuclease